MLYEVITGVAPRRGGQVFLPAARRMLRFEVYRQPDAVTAGGAVRGYRGGMGAQQGVGDARCLVKAAMSRGMFALQMARHGDHPGFVEGQSYNFV